MTFSPPRIAGIVILLMWGASLALPTLTTCSSGYDHAPGIFLLAIGWLVCSNSSRPGSHNILIVVIAGLLLVRQRAPVWLGAATALIAACGSYFPNIYDDRGTIPICHYHAGYYLWFAAAAAALIGTFLSRPVQPAN